MKDYENFVKRMGSFEMELPEHKDEELAHYGVLGMRWGRRHSGRYNNIPSGHVETFIKGKKTIVDRRVVSKAIKNKIRSQVPKKKEDNASDDHKMKIELGKKKLHEMSNTELRKLHERLQLEKQHSQLNPKHVQKGLSYVKSITAAGTTVAALYGLSRTPLAQDLIKILKVSFK